MAMDSKHCRGCEQDFYNGNNDLGVAECWHLKTAKLTRRKRVGMNEVPPWKGPSRIMPSCYQQRGAIFVEPNRDR